MTGRQLTRGNSWDREFNTQSVVIMAHDPVSGKLKRVTIDALNHYATCEIDKASATLLYEGLQDCDGLWQIVRTTTSGNVTSLRFATQLNNPTYTDYATAWTNRGICQYDYYHTAF